MGLIQIIRARVQAQNERNAKENERNKQIPQRPRTIGIRENDGTPPSIAENNRRIELPQWCKKKGGGNALKNSLQLTRPIGRNNKVLLVERNHSPNSDANLTDQEENGDPPPNLAKDGQNDEHGAGEQLISNRIKNFTQIGHFITRTSEVAVELISARCNDEQNRQHPAKCVIVMTPRSSDARQNNHEDHHHNTNHRGDIRRSLPL